MSQSPLALLVPATNEKPSSPRKAAYARACDACKLRKIKCDALRPCRSCESRGFECTQIRPPKRKGRTPKRIQEIADRQQRGSSASAAQSFEDEALLQSSSQPTGQDSDTTRHSSFITTYDLRPDESSLYPPSGDVLISGVNYETGRMLPAAGNPGLRSHVQNNFTNGQLGFGESASTLPSWTWNIASGIFQNQLQEAFSVGSCSGDAEYSMKAPEVVGMRQDYSSNNQSLREQGEVCLESLVSGRDQSRGSQVDTIQVSQPTDFAQKPAENGKLWPQTIGEELIFPLIDVFFERLHATLPVLDRSTVYRDLMNRRHRTDRQFGAMILSLCAFALIQPVQTKERFSTTTRDLQATMMLEEASRMHYSSEFGEDPMLEGVLTGLFMHGCHFGRHQLNAAWIKLREAVSLAIILGLQNPENYRGLSAGQRNRRLRIYFILCVTERTFGMVCRRAIEFKGRPGLLMHSIYDPLEFMDDASGITIHHQRDIKAMVGLQQMIAVVDDIDELFIQCANGSCGPGHHFDSSQALFLHQRWTQTDQLIAESRSDHLQDSQQVDIDVLRYWIINRLWNVCLAHSLLSTTSPYPQLRFQYAIDIAQRTLQICNSYGIDNLEIHGVGMILRIYDIANSVIRAKELLLQSRSNLQHEEDNTISWQSETQDEDQVDDSDMLSASRLLEDYSDLMNRFRDGNHIYLELFCKNVKDSR